MPDVCNATSVEAEKVPVDVFMMVDQPQTCKTVTSAGGKLGVSLRCPTVELK